MKKLFKFLLLITPLSLCGCDFDLSSLFSKDSVSQKEDDNQNNGSSTEVKPSENEPGVIKPTEEDPGNAEPIENEPSEPQTPGTSDPGTTDPGTTQPGENEPEVDPGEAQPHVDPDPTPPNPGTTDPEPEITVETEKIEGMFMSDGFITVKTSKYVYATVEIQYADGYDWESAGDEIEWSTSDSGIATVNSYGKVTGIAKGKTTLTATLKVSKHSCNTTIYVYENESDIIKTWDKLGSSDVINDNDSIIIACSQESKAATDVDTGHELHSTNITLSSDKKTITNVGDAAQFYVYRDYKGRNGYNFEVLGSEKSKFLGCTNTDNVSYFDTAKSSSTVWSLEYDSDNNCWDMRSTTNVDGWMMYNKDTGRFANYQSNETEHMFVVSLYRLNYTINV